MQGSKSKALQTFAVALVALLAWPQLAGAQRRVTPLPHPIGYPQQAPAQTEAGAASADSPWTPLRHQPTFMVDGSANPILMMDGSVLVQDAGFPDWWKLTPDQTGSYVNGTWTQIASLPAGYSPLYHSSAVLPDGRLIIEGGEYICDPTTFNCNAVWTNLGAIYDPVKNKWTSVNPPAGWTSIGDAQSVVLPNGTYMQANCCTKQAALLDPKTLTWTPTGKHKYDPNDEEGWTLLPNGKVLAVDAYVPISPFPYIPTGKNYELYDPWTGNWTVAGETPVQLWDSWLTCGELSQEPNNGPTFELGPAVLRPDGTVFYTGSNTCPNATGNSAIYNSYTNRWTAGPDFPGGNNVSDGPASLEVNGKVLVMASPGFGNPPSAFFEWDGKDLTEVPGPPNASVDGSYYGNMLVLPTGQILLTDFSNDIEIYTSKGRPQREWAPFVLFAPPFIERGQSYQAFGFLFNGLSQGAAYGDDDQSATNFPLVRITNLTTGHVRYSRAHDPSTMAVVSDQFNSVWFDVPANQERGFSKLEVVANGIPSEPVFVFVAK
ncbi:MAG TPA: kelch repeat-containing protein [Candidatus Eremiobacteraceae bacterium]|nr:kelch repeat-containing protein [Candidatus Eremiobacteraceae bacterium]